MPKRIPKNPMVAMLVVGLPHCEVIMAKDTIARRMPVPIVIRTGFHETFSGAVKGSISVPSSDPRGRNQPRIDSESNDDPRLRASGKWSNTLCSSRQCDLLIIPKNRTFVTDVPKLREWDEGVNCLLDFRKDTVGGTWTESCPFQFGDDGYDALSAGGRPAIR